MISCCLYQILLMLFQAQSNEQKILIDIIYDHDIIQAILYYATTSRHASCRDSETGTSLSRCLQLTGTRRRDSWSLEMLTSTRFRRSSMDSMTLIKGYTECLVYLCSLLIINSFHSCLVISGIL